MARVITSNNNILSTGSILLSSSGSTNIIVNGTSLVYASGSGIVGINNSSPKYTLDVAGTSSANIFTGSYVSVGSAQLLNLSSSGLLFYSGGRVVNDSAKLNWDSTNYRFGIGTSSLNAILHINANNSGDSNFLLEKTAGQIAYSITPWTNQVYIGAGVYYKDTAWITQNGGNSTYQLFSLKPGTGATWYGNGAMSNPITDTKTLWNDSGSWVSSINTNSITGSLLGTASYALTSSYINGYLNSIASGSITASVNNSQFVINSGSNNLMVVSSSGEVTLSNGKVNGNAIVLTSTGTNNGISLNPNGSGYVTAGGNGFMGNLSMPSNTPLNLIGGNALRMSSTGPITMMNGTSSVGIGTTSPSAKLHISGSTANETELLIQNASGSNLLFVSSSGRIGINTTASLGKLHIDTTTGGENALVLNTTSQNNYYKFYFSTPTGGGSDLNIESQNGDGRIKLKAYALEMNGLSNIENCPNIGFKSGNGNLKATNISLQTDNANTYVFQGGYNNNTIIRGYNHTYPILLAPTGSSKVGIGLSSNPSAKLHISGSSDSETELLIQNNSGSNLLVVSSSGNVGIGTTTPAYNFEVSGSSKLKGHLLFGNLATIPSTNTHPDYKFLWFPNNCSIGGDDVNSYANIALRSNIARYTGGSQWCYASNGPAWSMGIGHGSNVDCFYINRSPSGIAGNDLNGTYKSVFYISSSGNVGIGTNTPVNKLDVVGNISCSVITASLLTGTASYATSASYAPNPITESNGALYYGLERLTMGAQRRDPTGFYHSSEDRIESTLSYNVASKTFAISGSNFKVYSAGKEYTKNTEALSLSSQATGSIARIYYDPTTLNLSVTYGTWNISSTAVPIATVYYDGRTGIIGDERHGIQMDGATQEYLHETMGPRYAYGYPLTHTGSNPNFVLGAGHFYDDDLGYYDSDISQSRLIWHSGSVMVSTDKQPRLWVTASGTTTIAYDNLTTTASVASGRFVAYWVYATNGYNDRVVTVMGQRTDNTLANARTNNNPATLVFGTFPLDEAKLLWRIIYDSNGVVQDITDYRQSQYGGSAYVATDHGTLSGLSDDDHQQYLLLGGRGGQTITDQLTVTGITSSLQGTASYALTASYSNTAKSASYANAAYLGEGTDNYIPKWSNNQLANANIYDNAGQIGVGTTDPRFNFDVNGNAGIGPVTTTMGEYPESSNFTLQTNGKPVVPGTVYGNYYAGTNNFYDDGNGNIIDSGDLNIVGSINYSSGYVSMVSAVSYINYGVMNKKLLLDSSGINILADNDVWTTIDAVNTYGQTSILMKPDPNSVFAVQKNYVLSDGVCFSSVNSDNSANQQMEFRASNFVFNLGDVTAQAYKSPNGFIQFSEGQPDPLFGSARCNIGGFQIDGYYPSLGFNCGWNNTLGMDTTIDTNSQTSYRILHSYDDTKLHIYGNSSAAKGDALTRTIEMVMDGNNGRIGVNTTNPAYTFDVTGDINFTGNLLKNGSVYVPTTAATASYVVTAQSASYVVTAQSASYVNGTSVKGTVGTSSLATTASYYGNSIINGQLPAQINVAGVTASFTGSHIGNTTGTASYATNAATASYLSGSVNGSGITNIVVISSADYYALANPNQTTIYLVTA